MNSAQGDNNQMQTKRAREVDSSDDESEPSKKLRLNNLEPQPSSKDGLLPALPSSSPKSDINMSELRGSLNALEEGEIAEDSAPKKKKKKKGRRKRKCTPGSASTSSDTARAKLDAAKRAREKVSIMSDRIAEVLTDAENLAADVELIGAKEDVMAVDVADGGNNDSGAGVAAKKIEPFGRKLKKEKDQLKGEMKRLEKSFRGVTDKVTSTRRDLRRQD